MTIEIKRSVDTTRILPGTRKRPGDSMKLTHVGEMVMEVFEMTGFADILNIEA